MTFGPMQRHLKVAVLMQKDPQHVGVCALSSIVRSAIISSVIVVTLWLG